MSAHRADTTRLHALLDTNVYLHYRLFTEVDWREALGAGEVVLVLPLEVTRELDKIKDGHRVRAVKQRARIVLARIDEILQSGSSGAVREGVILRSYRATDLREIGVQLQLDFERADERVLASAVSYMRAEAPPRFQIVARDRTIRLLARELGVDVVAPPVLLELEAEEDPVAKQLAEAQREIARLRAARPHLSLGLLNGGNRLEVGLPPRNVLTSEVLDRQVAERMSGFPPVEGLPQRPQAQQGLAAALASYGEMLRSSHVGFRDAPAPELERYARERKVYERNLRAYFSVLHEWRQRVARSIVLTLEIKNSGASPARDVYVYLSLPSGIRVETKDTAPRAPEAPPLPVGPRFVTFNSENWEGDYYKAGFLPSRASERERYAFIQPLSLWEPEIERTLTGGTRVALRSKKMQPGDATHLEPLLLHFERPEEQSFGIDYEIRCDELEPVTGRLHIVVVRSHLRGPDLPDE